MYKKQEGKRVRNLKTETKSGYKRNLRKARIQLKKRKKKDHLKKRRKEPAVCLTDELKEKLKGLDKLKQHIESKDKNLVFVAVENLRELSGVDGLVAIDPIIKMGFIPFLIKFCTFNDWPELQQQSLWAISNILNAIDEDREHDFTENILKAKVGETTFAKKLMELFDSKNKGVLANLLYTVGNIIGARDIKFRDLFLKYKIIPKVLMIISNFQHEIFTLREAVWVLSNLCKNKPSPDWNEVKQCILPLVCLVPHSDKQILEDSCWTVSYIADGPQYQIDELIEHGIHRYLVTHLKKYKHNHKILRPVIRAIGNIIQGDNKNTDILIKRGLMDNLKELILSPDDHIVKEVIWIYSNLLAGSKLHIKTVVDSKILELLVPFLKHDHFPIRKETCWVYSNSFVNCDINQLRTFNEEIPKIIEIYCDNLDGVDTSMTKVVLEGIKHILKRGEECKSSHFKKFVEKCGGIDKLEKLQNHSNEELYKTALYILERYFDASDEEDPEGNYDFMKVNVKKNDYDF